MARRPQVGYSVAVDGLWSHSRLLYPALLDDPDSLWFHLGCTTGE